MKFVPEFSFKTKILLLIVVGIILSSTITFFYSTAPNNNYEKLVIIIINSLVLALLYWIVSRTSYTLKNEILICKSGPFKKEIPINSITKISYHKGLIVPAFWKLSLSDSGFIINYGKFEDIYISPQDCELFIEELIKINPNILIK